MSHPLVGLLLAAGASRRFGSDKLLAPLADGVPVAVHAFRHLRPAVDEVIAVVRPGNGPLAERLRREGAEVVICADAERGLGASLASGVRASSEAQGWLVALADMPWIRPATVQAVAEALRSGAPLAAPVYRGRRGHPVGFAAEFRAALLELDGDEGARAILAGHPERLRRVDREDAGVLRDVDEPGDLEGPVSSDCRR
jgi:molybdenum cofactor cytidylyltransferase